MRGDFGTDEIEIALINFNNGSRDGPRLKRKTRYGALPANSCH
jgi:hypothetical protein